MGTTTLTDKAKPRNEEKAVAQAHYMEGNKEIVYGAIKVESWHQRSTHHRL